MTLSLAKRFRGYLPVIVDVETAGFDAKRDALLEIAAIPVKMDEQGIIYPGEAIHHHIEPFPGLNLDPAALEFTGIKPFHPFRFAKKEDEALKDIFKKLRSEMQNVKCQRSVLVGHNAFFDISFLQAAVNRNDIKKSPFHPFTTFDTATLSALAFGQTVLAKALYAANIPFDPQKAHSALYDAEVTAQLFCEIVNKWKNLGGWIH